MKKLLLSLLISFFSYQGIAQEPDPDLFQTWYVYYFDDDDYVVEVSEIDPPISPYITISENLNFNGEGACNSFNGIFSLPFPNILETIEFTNTTTDCGFQNHNSFESHYFGLIATGGDYQITQDEGGLELHLSLPIMIWAEFRNYPLSTSDFNLNEIKIYPNPSSTRIFIKSQKDPISKIELYNLLGASIKTLNNNVESIDISDLTSGIYLLKIFAEHETTVKKIIKK